MQNFEKNNWAIMEERFSIKKPDFSLDAGNIEVFTSRSGVPTARVQLADERTMQIHSAMDPRREAQRLAESLIVEPGEILIVQGFGFGYLVEALLQAVPSSASIIVIEPDWKLFLTAMRVRDLEKVFQSSQIAWVITEEVDAVKSAFRRAYDREKHSGVKFTGLPGYLAAYEDYFNKVYTIIKDVINVSLLNLATLIKMGGDSTTNTFKNLPYYIANPGVRTLFDQFKDVPAIIVAAGPSLDKNIDLLHEAKGKAVIIAVGTAAKALQKKGIQPDFIKTIDPHALNYEHFKDVDTEKSCLITDIRSNWMITANYKGPMFVLGYVPVTNWIKDVVEDKGATESGGSVANNAMTVAYHMGANPIVLVGQDLAFARDGKTHAAGTAYEKNVAASKEKDMFYVKANDGGELLTARNFYQFLRFFEDWFRMFPDRKYINATEGGAFIEGTEVMTLRDVLNQYCTRSVNVTDKIREIQTGFQPTAEKEQVVKVFEERRQQISILLKQAEKAVAYLDKLHKACAKGQQKSMGKISKALKKIYERMQEDTDIVPIAESFIHHDIHGVMHRTYRAEYDENDDYNKVIDDYRIYYEKVGTGLQKTRELTDDVIEQIKVEVGGRL